MKTVKKHIVITGGHLSPAWATIKELKSQRLWQITYLGRRYSSTHTRHPSDEARFIPTLGISFIGITTGRLPTRIKVSSLTNFIHLPLGWIQIFFILRQIHPNVVLSFGGYLGLPAVASARLLGIPSIIHEQTATTGLANSLAITLASRIAVSFPSSLKHFPAHKTTLTGNPLRLEIFTTNKRFLSKTHHLAVRPIIYITGGNQGARDLNLPLIQALPKLLKKYSIIHQIGDHELQRTS